MWNYKSSNEIINELNCLRSHREHLERLILSKSVLNTKRPYTPMFLINNASNVQNEKNRLMKISYENRLLYNNMRSISCHHSPYSKGLNNPKYCPAFDYKKYDWVPRRKLLEIEKENQVLKKRYEDSKSFYPRQKYVISNINKMSLIKQNKKKSRIFNPNLKFCTFEKFKNNLYKEIQKLASNKRDLSYREYRRGELKELSRDEDEFENQKILRLKKMSVRSNSAKNF